jgi:outer membrane receptor for Fe3+-dicitrate
MEKPLLSKHRGFVNLAYETKGWKFDYTVNFNSSKRIPNTSSNPTQYVQPPQSPSFVLMNAQVSKALGKQNAVEVYLGGENLGNFIQQNAIIAPEDPFGKYFDASLVWGPVTGRMVYAGFRYKLK